MKTERQLKIIYLCLQRQRVTIRELADKLEVSRRTIFRDLEALSAAGIPVVTYPGAGGGVGIMEGFTLDRSLLTKAELASLATALGGIHSIDRGKDIELLMDKLLPPHTRAAAGGDIIIDLSSWFEGDEIDDMFLDLRRAIAEHVCIELDYSTRGMLSRRRVEPYKLVFKYQSWYLYAFCLTRQAFRVFKLTRIADYRLSGEPFAPRQLGDLVFQLPGRDEPEPHTAGQAPVEVLLEYAVAYRDLLMDTLGAQDFQDEGERGRVRLVTTNLPWMADLVMGLQDRVKVLEPPVLRREVQSRIERMRAVYRD